MTGPLALASIAALRFDTAVLAPCGLAGGQVTAHDLGDAAVKQAMIASAARVVVAADGSKFRQTAMAMVCATDAVDMVITDADGAGRRPGRAARRRRRGPMCLTWPSPPPARR